MKMLKEKREIEVNDSTNINLKVIIFFLGIVISFPVFSQKELIKEIEFKKQLQGKWQVKNYTNIWRIIHYKQKQFYSIEFFDSTFKIKTIEPLSTDTTIIIGNWYFLNTIYGSENAIGITLSISISENKNSSGENIVPCIGCPLFYGMHTDIWEIKKIKKKHLFVFPIIMGIENQIFRPYKFKFKKIK